MIPTLSPAMRMGGYVSLVPLWAVIIFNFISPLPIDWLQQALYWTGIIMAVVHLAEVFVFLPKLQPAPNPVVGALMLFFFGVVYASGFADRD